ncbi:MAG: UDP-N-acetylmuramoyl-L-alanyl-D-glutamate--2,6-diaminopimelate ligase [Actinobacteria bacterium]|nr:UDP-N-acetylmuramoyl-L-alanyl-D-glutamate--2,6-diaminopimelate ligase [Actinomycetota bacterium]
MIMNKLLKDVKIKKIYFKNKPEIKGLSLNSKSVKPGDLFTAIIGFNKDGHDFAVEAVKNGAVAVMSQRKLDLPADTAQIIVSNSREELPVICRNFFGNPTKDILLTGVTGTNGKTTSVFLINSILRTAGFKTSFITTVSSQIEDKKLSFDRTTPESIDLNKFFYMDRLDGVNAACIEVSSHSIDLHRADYLHFDCFVFTNLTQDHLDWHKSMENYFKTKLKLFLKQYRNIFGGESAVINIDDAYGKEIVKLTDLETYTYGIEDKSAHLKAENIAGSIKGIKMDVRYSMKKFNKSHNTEKKFSIESSLCGYFNVYNILASCAVGLINGLSVENIKEGIKIMPGVKGRFERIVTKKGINAIVDYAHTPGGLESVLKTARLLLLSGGRLISVFGCGGDRDKTKRAVMGQISAGLADFSIITSDNPRTEDPEVIIQMIEDGFIQLKKTNYVIEVERKRAIFKALKMAGSKDIVLIAGKGHEDYQEFAGKRIHFSDQEVIKEWDDT